MADENIKWNNTTTSVYDLSHMKCKHYKVNPDNM